MTKPRNRSGPPFSPLSKSASLEWCRLNQSAKPMLSFLPPVLRSPTLRLCRLRRSWILWPPAWNDPMSLDGPHWEFIKCGCTKSFGRKVSPAPWWMSRVPKWSLVTPSPSTNSPFRVPPSPASALPDATMLFVSSSSCSSRDHNPKGIRRPATNNQPWMSWFTIAADRSGLRVLSTIHTCNAMRCFDFALHTFVPPSVPSKDRLKESFSTYDSSCTARQQREVERNRSRLTYHFTVESVPCIKNLLLSQHRVKNTNINYKNPRPLADISSHSTYESLIPAHWAFLLY